MDITDVQVKLIGRGDERLKASCTIVFDEEFVVRDVKIIQGTNGLFVAMPSRKVMNHCPKCSGKNHLRARFCNQCGQHLPEYRIDDESGVHALHAEVAHPINSQCRDKVHTRVIAAYESASAEGGRRSHDSSTPKHRQDNEIYRNGVSPAASGESAPRHRAERSSDVFATGSDVNRMAVNPDDADAGQRSSFGAGL